MACLPKPESDSTLVHQRHDAEETYKTSFSTKISNEKSEELIKSIGFVTG